MHIGLAPRPVVEMYGQVAYKPEGKCRSLSTPAVEGCDGYVSCVGGNGGGVIFGKSFIE